VVDTSDATALMESLHTLTAEQTYLLYPTGDAHVRHLSDHRADLPAHCIGLLPAQEVVTMLLDKTQFDQFCKTHDFPVPRTELIKNSADLSSLHSRLSFPVIAKTPIKVNVRGLEKAYIFERQDELEQWYASILPLQREFLLQEYIPGADRAVFFTMQYISPTGRLLASFTGRKIRQFPPFKGGTSAAEPSYNEFLTELTYNFFRKAGFWGIGSMEYKQDARTGKFYLIEPTVCRTDFQEGVAIANGVNIPFIAYQDLIGQVVEPTFQKKEARKVWLHPCYDQLSRDQYMARGELTYTEWLASLRHARTFDAFSLRDPGPLWLTLQTKFSKRARKMFSYFGFDSAT